MLSTQHDPDITQGQIQLDIKKYVFDEILPGGMVDENTKFYINPTGRFGTGKLSDERITEIVRENFDFRPAGIIKELTLRRPIYRQTAAYGHFGREDLDLPWERLDKANELKKYL